MEALLRRMPFSDAQVFDITLAIGEAMGNALAHTDGRAALVTVSAYPDRAVIDVTDRGCGISVRRGQLPAQERPNEERGRGIKLMRLLADSVTIRQRSGGCGTLARSVKLV